MIDQQTLGKRIKYFRKRANLSQFQLELEIGASAGSISRIESGEVNPTKETLIKLNEILNLNEREQDYLYGSIAEPASTELIAKAILEVRGYFSKKGVLAYLLDDRIRLIYVSDDFIKVLGFDKNMWEKTKGKTLIRFFLEDQYKMKEKISPEHYEEVLYNLLARFYAESGFMEDDKYYQESIYFIKNDKFANEMWNKITLTSPTNVHTLPQREVFFRFFGQEVSMFYSDEPLPKYRRFEVVEYTPTNFLIRLLSKL